MAESLIMKRRIQLQEAVSEMGRLVVEALKRSVTCLETHDLELAARIIASDARVNQQRRILEQDCLVTLAAYKPAGEDLRAVGACMELVSELERIGDYAADVARIMLKAGPVPFPAAPVAAIVEVAADAIGMVEDILAAFSAHGDEQMAREAIAREDQVDRKEDAVIDEVLDRMRQDGDFAITGTYLLWIVHNYERAADRATNVAERVVYIASGQTPDLD